MSTTQQTCTGCIHLRPHLETIDLAGRDGEWWVCLDMGRKVGENTPYSYRPPRPERDDCWRGEE